MLKVVFFGEDTRNILALNAALNGRCRFKHTADLFVCKSWVSSEVPDLLIVSRVKSGREAVEVAAFAWASGFSGTLLYSSDSDVFQHELAIAGFLVVEPAEIVSKALFLIGEAEPSRERKPRLLVVDDLDTPRDVICAYVERFGYEAVGVSSASEAMGRLLSAPAEFACIITDINMPKVKGTQLIEQIRSTEKLSKLPIIVLTAYGTGECLVESMEAGASGFLVKPPRREDMRRELARAELILRGLEGPRLVSRLDLDRLKEII